MLVVLKVGGSVITDKSKPFAIRWKELDRVASEISEALSRVESLRLVVVHGGGSYGHFVVDEFRRYGEEFSSDMVCEVVRYMRELNGAVVDALRSHGVPAVGFDTHAMTVRVGSADIEMFVEPIAEALKRKLVPTLYGDIVVGKELSIVSGDEIAWFLASRLGAKKLLFATSVDGVYTEDPRSPRAKLIHCLKLSDIEKIAFSKVEGFDVTGGMLKKLKLATKYMRKDLEVLVFNGLKEGSVLRAILGTLTSCTRLVP